MPMSLKRFCGDGELFKPTELPSSWSDRFFCSYVCFLTSPKHHTAVNGPYLCVCVCVCVNLRGFLNTCCWHGLCSQAPSVTGATHTPTHRNKCFSSVPILLNKTFLHVLQGCAFFPYSYCAKMWTWQPQPTHSYITSRTFIFGFYKMHISEMWLPNSQHILIFSTWISMLGAINESNTNSVLHSSTYSLQANVFSYLHSSSSQSGLIFSSFKRTCLLHTMPLRSYHSYLHKILGSMCSVGCWL